jgi:hypothetical protein
MKNSWLERFIDMPPSKRRKVTLTSKGLEKQIYRKQRRLTREQVVMFLVDHKITTQTKLKRHQENSNAPSFYHIRKFFPADYYMSCWDKARDEIFNISKPTHVAEPSLMAIIKMAEFCKIQTLQQYCQLRKNNKDLLPSKYMLYKLFGSFNNLKRIIQSLDPRSIISRYLLLKHELGGRWPSRRECRENGVEIQNLTISKQNLRWTIRMLEEPRAFVQRAIR